MPPADLLELTEHHLFPKRYHPRGLRNNRVMIPRGIHQAWHRIVSDVVPEEALTEIVRHWLSPTEVGPVSFETRFARDSVRPVCLRYANSPTLVRAFSIVFPTQRPLEILKLWAWQWVPTDYVSSLSVRIGRDIYNIRPDNPDTDLIAKIKHRQLRKLEEMQTAA